MNQLAIWIIIAILAAIMLFYYKRSKKPVRKFLLGSSSGLITLAAIQLIASDLLGLSVASIAVSIILGLPGVVTMLIFNQVV